jgi:hypothetical protein
MNRRAFLVFCAATVTAGVSRPAFAIPPGVLQIFLYRPTDKIVTKVVRAPIHDTRWNSPEMRKMIAEEQAKAGPQVVAEWSYHGMWNAGDKFDGRQWGGK